MLDDEGGCGAGARGGGVGEGEAGALEEGWVFGEAEALFDDVTEEEVGRVRGGVREAGRVGGGDAEDVEVGLGEEVGDGPLVVDLVADVRGEDDGDAGGHGEGGEEEQERRGGTGRTSFGAACGGLYGKVARRLLQRGGVKRAA